MLLCVILKIEESDSRSRVAVKGIYERKRERGKEREKERERDEGRKDLL